MVLNQLLETDIFWSHAIADRRLDTPPYRDFAQRPQKAGGAWQGGCALCAADVDQMIPYRPPPYTEARIVVWKRRPCGLPQRNPRVLRAFTAWENGVKSWVDSQPETRSCVGIGLHTTVAQEGAGPGTPH